MKIKLGLGEWSVKEAAESCGGKFYGFSANGGDKFSYICTDSREADSETLFVATRGEKVDGHDYIASAMKLGCKCFLCERIPEELDTDGASFAVVKDSISAFAMTARAYRKKLSLPVVAVTGSVGKTTTKELVSLVLREKFSEVYSTEGNFNSVIGMPMSLMAAESRCEVAVFEMGMSARGEISSMSRTATPSIAMVTNVGTSHLEYLGSRDNIAKAKLEIADGLCDGGYLLLNGDEPLLKKHYKKPRGKKINLLYISADGTPSADVRAENIVIDGEKTVFDFHFGDRAIKGISLPVGKHFVWNALFAATCGCIVGASDEEIINGLSKYKPVGYRQNLYKKDGVTVIADCYNASPESMRAAIDVLDSIECEGKKIAVLGDMKELGEREREMHSEIGKYLVGRADMLFTVGPLASHIAESAMMNGISPTRVFAAHRSDSAELFCEILANLCEGDVILFKASRSVKLEETIKGINMQA